VTVERPFDPEDAQIGEGLSLLVVERPSKVNFVVKEIKTADAVQEELTAAWARSLELASDDDILVEYSPDLVLRAGDPEIPVVSHDLSEENEIIAGLLADEDLAQEAPDSVSSEDLYLYALISDTDAGRIAMIKKQAPAKQARSGKWWALAGDELRLLEDDPWQLHPTFDLIVSEEGAYVLRYSALEQLLADSALLLERVDDWVGSVAASLPLSDGGDTLLFSRCVDSSRLRRRLRAIYDRGHLAQVDISDVKKHVEHMEFDPDDFISNGELVIDEQNVDSVLQLLNEDLFNGGLTGDPFRSDGKAPL
jgi:hypothetical protein